MGNSELETLLSLESAAREGAQRGGGGPYKAFVDQVQHSLLYQYSATESAYALPSTLSVLTALYTASGDEKASSVNLKPATGGWKYIEDGNDREKSLNRCLVYVADTGRKAMFNAATKASKTTITLNVASQTSAQLVDLLPSLPDSVHHLSNQLEKLADTFAVCLKDTDESGRSLDDWILSTIELYLSVSVAQGNTDSDYSAEVENVRKLQAAVLDLEQARDSSKQALKEAAQGLSTRLDNVQKCLERVNDNTPPSWQASIKSIKKAVTQSGPLIVAQSLPALFDSAVGPANRSTKDSQSSISSPPSSKIPAADPAHTGAVILLPFLEELHACLSFGVNDRGAWAKLRQDDGGAGAKWLLSNIKSVQDHAQLESSAASQSLKSVFEKTIRTIESINAGSSASSDQVSGWLREVKDSRAVVLQLISTAASFPGAAQGGIIMASEDNSDGLRGADASAQVAALSTAIGGVLVSKQALQTTQQTNTLAGNNAATLQTELAELQARLGEVAEESDVLTKTRKILYQSLGPVVLLKAQNIKMKSLLGAALVITGQIMQGRAEQYRKDPSFGGRSYLQELAINTLMDLTFQVRALLLLAKEISALSNQLDRDYISPGLAIVNGLAERAQLEPRMVRRYADQAKEHARRASEEINRIVRDRQEKTTAMLDNRIKGVDRQTKLIPREEPAAPDAAVTQAVEKGGAVVSDYVKEHASVIFGSLKVRV